TLQWLLPRQGRSRAVLGERETCRTHTTGATAHATTRSSGLTSRVGDGPPGGCRSGGFLGSRRERGRLSGVLRVATSRRPRAHLAVHQGEQKRQRALGCPVACTDSSSPSPPLPKQPVDRLAARQTHRHDPGCSRQSAPVSAPRRPAPFPLDPRVDPSGGGRQYAPETLAYEAPSYWIVGLRAIESVSVERSATCPEKRVRLPESGIDLSSAYCSSFRTQTAAASNLGHFNPDQGEPLDAR